MDSTHLHSTILLEQELQCKLNESRIVELAAHKSEARVIRRAARRVRRAKLDAIKGVEKLGSELKPKPVIRTEICRFVYRYVPVIDPSASECGIHTRLIAKLPRPGSCEAILVEPRESRRGRHVRRTLFASRHKIRTQLKVL